MTLLSADVHHVMAQVIVMGIPTVERAVIQKEDKTGNYTLLVEGTGLQVGYTSGSVSNRGNLCVGGRGHCCWGTPHMSWGQAATTGVLLMSVCGKLFSDGPLAPCSTRYTLLVEGTGLQVCATMTGSRGLCACVC
jgi:hypothetical protein